MKFSAFLLAAFLSSSAAFLPAAPVVRHVAGSVILLPNVAHAAKYGSFGAGSPEVLTDFDIDRDILASNSVQSALSQVKRYQGVVQDLQKTLSSDPQANLKKTILKELDISKLREALNVPNSALEEDSQRGSDRLIRVILQDITEIEIANSQKDNVERSPRRLEILNNKLAKLDTAFDDYLKIFS